MLHPTQNRPPRAQAIKERREHREWLLARDPDIRWFGIKTYSSKSRAHSHKVPWTDSATATEVAHG